jgi:hypothetical protein
MRKHRDEGDESDGIKILISGMTAGIILMPPSFMRVRQGGRMEQCWE